MGFVGSVAPAHLPVGPRGVDLLVNAAQLFGVGEPQSVAPPLEARLVAYGLKRAALTQGPESIVTSLLNWAERHNLVAVLSPFEWWPFADTGKGGYCNLGGGRQRARAGTGAWRSLIVAADEEVAILAWLALAYGWDELLGRLLDYPLCCAEAFDRRWDDAVSAHQGDLSIPTLEASGPPPYDWRINILGRYFGLALIEHFPCRYDCVASVALANRHSLALRHYEPELFQQLEETLGSPVVYSEREGVVLLREAKVTTADGETVRVQYDPTLSLLTDDTSDLSRALRRTNELVGAADGKHVEFGLQKFEAHLIWFARDEQCVT